MGQVTEGQVSGVCIYVRLGATSAPAPLLALARDFADPAALVLPRENLVFPDLALTDLEVSAVAAADRPRGSARRFLRNLAGRKPRLKACAHAWDT